jgi:hypothetical protein
MKPSEWHKCAAENYNSSAQSPSLKTSTSDKEIFLKMTDWKGFGAHIPSEMHIITVSYNR